MPFLLLCLFPVYVFLCLLVVGLSFYFSQLLLLLVVAPSVYFFSLFPLPLLLFFFRLFSYASIINLCGSFVFNRFVELF
ncbi:hypothetical protein NC651_004500 [Populus alba x Populus x berolinensis]|nr:hypothetical protein NC651_004500 [Populus alba x Populus x berolinensis]